MDTVNEGDITALLARAGVTPTPADRQQLKSVWEKYLERLKTLHAADLDDEEVAGYFLPEGPPEGEQG